MLFKTKSGSWVVILRSSFSGHAVFTVYLSALVAVYSFPCVCCLVFVLGCCLAIVPKEVF